MEKSTLDMNASMDRERGEDGRVNHLYAVLSAIRDINRLIITEKSQESLIEGVCRSLVERRGFHNAWIVLIDGERRITAAAEAGLGPDFRRLLEYMQQSRFPKCCEALLVGEGIYTAPDPQTACTGCPLSRMYGGRGSLSARLEHSGRFFGVLTVSTPEGFSDDPEEQELFKDVADDIAYALYSIEVEEDRREKVAALREARDQLELRVRQRTEALSELSSRLITAQEEERKRVAGDLHDGIGQCISAVKFMVETVMQQLSGKVKEQDLKSLQALIPLLQASSEEVRNMTMNLRPTILDDLGVIATINWFCRQFQMVYSHIRIEKRVEMVETDVPDALKITIFRVLQEAMNNIAKHSDADAVEIYVGKVRDVLVLTVTDNGRGFEMREIQNHQASSEFFGIIGMRERVELTSGRFRIQAAHGAGTQVRAEWDCICPAVDSGAPEALREAGR